MKEVFGGTWEMLGDERIRRWPSKIGEKRPLDVNITTWDGISPGDKHYSVHISEEDNQFWSESENAWVNVSMDTEKRGYSLRAEVLSEKEAISLAFHFVEMVAGKTRRGHFVTWSGPGRPRWGH